MQALIAVLVLPLMLLNFLGGIVGAIWLMFLGEWGALGIALIATIFGAMVCGFALMPGMLVTAPAMLMYEKGGAARIASYPLMFVGLLWTFAVMSGWALFWFAYFLKRADASSLVPMLLIAFSVATGPWAYMAQKEAQSGNEYSSITTFFLQIACAVILVMLAFAGAHPFTALVVFLVIMAIAFLFNLGMGIAMAAAQTGSVRNVE
jgi:hypothetical protein